MSQNRRVSLNDVRRHLNESQKGIIAAKWANMKVGDNRGQGRPTKGRAPVPSLSETENKPISLLEAAEKVGIGRRTAVSCKKVIRDGVPELVKAVEDGEIRAKPAEKMFNALLSLTYDPKRGKNVQKKRLRKQFHGPPRAHLVRKFCAHSGR